MQPSARRRGPEPSGEGGYGVALLRSRPAADGGSDPAGEGGFDDRHRNGPRNLRLSGRRDEGANPGPRGRGVSRHAASQTGRETRIT